MRSTSFISFPGKIVPSVELSTGTLKGTSMICRRSFEKSKSSPPPNSMSSEIVIGISDMAFGMISRRRPWLCTTLFVVPNLVSHLTSLLQHVHLYSLLFFFPLSIFLRNTSEICPTLKTTLATSFSSSQAHPRRRRSGNIHQAVPVEAIRAAARNERQGMRTPFCLSSRNLFLFEPRTTQTRPGCLESLLPLIFVQDG